MIRIVSFQPKYQDEVVQLVTYIQQIEFNVPVTLAEQPDLQDIQGFFFNGAGHFWCALDADDRVVGTIALIDIGGNGVIRKMFVHRDFRGKQHGIGALLLQTLEQWSREQGLMSLSLGTRDMLQAACRFYAKSGYSVIEPDSLPSNFPRMKVDDLFFYKKL